MRSGFTFKNRHSDEFGIIVRTDNRPLIPAVKTVLYSAALADGEYDFSAANSIGREVYKPREFSMIIQIYADNIAGLNRKAARVAAWLVGGGYLIFDDTPFVRWYATVRSEIAFMPQNRGRTAVITAVFSTAAFGEAVWSAEESLPIDTVLSIDSYILLDASAETVIEADKDKEYIIETGSFSDMPVRGIFTIGGSGGTLCVGSDKGSMSVIKENGKTLVIDCKNYRITSGGTEVAAEDGEFFEMYDTLVFNSDTTGKYTLSLEYRPLTVWDFELEVAEE